MIHEALSAESSPAPGGYRELPVASAAKYVGKVRMIDVREPDEFVGPLGHVQGAELVPLATVVTAAHGWRRDEPLMLMCRSGGRSARAAMMLASLGFQHLYNVSGGMLAWDPSDVVR